MRVVAALFAAVFLNDAAAQKFSPEQKTQAQPQQKAPYASTGRHDPRRERCENFRKELRRTRIQERETTNTGARDHAALHRQQILKDMQEAGC